MFFVLGKIIMSFLRFSMGEFGGLVFVVVIVLTGVDVSLLSWLAVSRKARSLSSSSIPCVCSCCTKPSSRQSVPILNRYVPKTEPWGAPALTGLGDDHSCPIFTVIVLPMRNEAISHRTWFEAPWSANALSTAECSSRLYALL